MTNMKFDEGPKVFREIARKKQELPVDKVIEVYSRLNLLWKKLYFYQWLIV